MSLSILFSAWKNAEETPELCPLCNERQPIFECRVTLANSDVQQGESQITFCCLPCGQQSLATLQELILAQWAEEGSKDETKQSDELPRL